MVRCAIVFCLLVVLHVALSKPLIRTPVTSNVGTHAWQANAESVPLVTEIQPNLQVGEISAGGEMPVTGSIKITGMFPVFGTVGVDGALPTHGTAYVDLANVFHDFKA